MLWAKVRTTSRMASASGGSSIALVLVTPRRVRPTRSAAAMRGSRNVSSVVARRIARWASCSQVMAMPPCTWVLRLAHRSAAGAARVAATAAA